MHITVKHGIDTCSLAHTYEHTGYEDDSCAGLSGEGDEARATAELFRANNKQTALNACVILRIFFPK